MRSSSIAAARKAISSTSSSTLEAGAEHGEFARHGDAQLAAHVEDLGGHAVVGGEDGRGPGQLADLRGQRAAVPGPVVVPVAADAPVGGRQRVAQAAVLGQARLEAEAAFAVGLVGDERRPHKAAVAALEQMVGRHPAGGGMVAAHARKHHRVVADRDGHAGRLRAEQVQRHVVLVGHERDDAVALPAARKRAGVGHVGHEVPAVLPAEPRRAAQARLGGDRGGHENPARSGAFEDHGVQAGDGPEKGGSGEGFIARKRRGEYENAGWRRLRRKDGERPGSGKPAFVLR
jgi:hypothetical protein